MNDLGIISVYLVAAAFTATVIMGGWIFCEVSWWIFVRIFGVVDSVLQDRHWRRLAKENSAKDRIEIYLDVAA